MKKIEEILAKHRLTTSVLFTLTGSSAPAPAFSHASLINDIQELQAQNDLTAEEAIVINRLLEHYKNLSKTMTLSLLNKK